MLHKGIPDDLTSSQPKRAHVDTPTHGGVWKFPARPGWIVLGWRMLLSLLLNHHRMSQNVCRGTVL
jgi:hypothetical protein